MLETLGAEGGGSPPEVSYYLDGAHTPESMLTCARWFADAAAEHAAAPTGSAGGAETRRVLLFNCTQARDAGPRPSPTHFSTRWCPELQCRGAGLALGSQGLGFQGLGVPELWGQMM